MIHQRFDSKSPFHAYFNSLDTLSPSVLSWPSDLQDTFQGTNLGIEFDAYYVRILEYLACLKDINIWLEANDLNSCCMIFSETIYNHHTLIWARGHYLARRYPGKYTTHQSTRLSSELTDVMERDMENLGCFIPVLDILNHNSDQDWLSFRIESNKFLVLCNYDVSAGSELYSNYGSLSNEKLLYAYGFLHSKNPYESVAVTLRTGMSEGPSDTSTVSRYYIAAGGIAGVPQELWNFLSQASTGDIESDQGENDTSDGDVEVGESSVEVGIEEMEALCVWLTKQILRLEKSSVECDPILKKYLACNDIRASYVQSYRQSQIGIITTLLTELNDVIDFDCVEEEEDKDADIAQDI